MFKGKKKQPVVLGPTEAVLATIGSQLDRTAQTIADIEQSIEDDEAMIRSIREGITKKSEKLAAAITEHELIKRANEVLAA